MTLSISEWLGLAGVLILLIGPGYGLLSFFPGRDQFDRTNTLTISLGLSIAIWSILLAWLHLLRIPLSPVIIAAILSGGWAIGLIRRGFRGRNVLSLTSVRQEGNGSRIALWSAVMLTAVVAQWSIRGVVAGPGSDSYHHTLITQMILDRGMLPDNYLPYAPLVTFTYHFGFHGIAAAVVGLTGLKPIMAVPILAQLLMAASALSVAFLTEVTTRSRPAAITGAIIAGLVAVFPAYFINWGRYPQLTGLVILPIFLGLIWRWIESNIEWSLVPFLSVLAAGIALVHYRVAFMAASGAVVLAVVSGVARRMAWSEWKHLAVRSCVAVLVAAILTAPWLAHLLATRAQGFQADVGTVGEMFFSLERFGPFVLSYPTNGVLIGLTLLALIAGWWWRERIVAAVSIWSVVMLLLSTLRLAGVFVDPISVVMSLYIPASLSIGLLAAEVVKQWRARARFAGAIMSTSLVSLSMWGAVRMGSIVEPGAAYVGPDDLPTIEWIRANTPPSARFMVNLFHFDFSPNYIIGSDAGYWLPLLAGRATVSAPMVYPSERSAWPDLTERLVALDQLGGHLTSPEALALLRREGITHVYIGQRGGPIVADELLRASSFKLEYQNGSTYVYRFLAEQLP
jgi:hypothetical protein